MRVPYHISFENSSAELFFCFPAPKDHLQEIPVQRESSAQFVALMPIDALEKPEHH